MQEVLYLLSAMSIFCTPMRSGVFDAAKVVEHVQGCEKKVWACVESKRKIAEGRRHSKKPSTTELEACFR